MKPAVCTQKTPYARHAERMAKNELEAQKNPY